jgi:signal transduction histidine kinase
MLPHLSGPTGLRRTVRLRLTALYCALFLACAAGLVTFINILAYTMSRLSEGQHLVALNQLLIESAIALIVMALAATALGWLMASRVLRPLRAMTAAARAISAENLSQRLAVHGPSDELKDLGDTFDGLLDRLETAFATQRRFAASASHELRTPLAMMRTSLDVATGKPAPVPRELTVLAAKLREGLDQADRLVENLLLLARAQHCARDDQEATLIGPLLADAIAARARLIASMELDVRHAADGALVTGNAVLLAQMTSNLIDNAVRHNHPGGWIRAQITCDGPSVRLTVDNGGPVLDPAKVTTLTQPFRRLGTDRTGSAGGTGLGLSITEAIVTAHGGTLHLHARPAGGLQSVIELPAAISPLVQLARTGAAR